MRRAGRCAARGALVGTVKMERSTAPYVEVRASTNPITVNHEVTTAHDPASGSAQEDAKAELLKRLLPMAEAAVAIGS